MAASLLTIALTGVALFTLDWRLALAGLAAVPIQFFASRWYLRASGPLYAAERRANSARGSRSPRRSNRPTPFEPSACARFGSRG